jgi:hypothetical protein
MAALPESRLRQMIDRFEQVEARMGVATPRSITRTLAGTEFKNSP